MSSRAALFTACVHNGRAMDRRERLTMNVEKAHGIAAESQQGGALRRSDPDGAELVEDDSTGWWA